MTELKRQGDIANADAVIGVSLSANEMLYKKLRRNEAMALENLEKLMQDVIVRREEAAMSEGISEGSAREIIEMGQEFGLGRSEILVRIQNRAGVTPEVARKYFAKYAKD
jgi:hypothetical protein